MGLFSRPPRPWDDSAYTREDDLYILERDHKYLLSSEFQAREENGKLVIYIRGDITYDIYPCVINDAFYLVVLFKSLFI